MKFLLFFSFCLVAVPSESQLQFVPPWIGVGNLPPQGITWGTATTISGDTDVDTTGTGIWAYAIGQASTSPTINGVSFTASTSSNPAGVLLGGAWGHFNGTFASSSNPYAALSASYKVMLASAYEIDGAGTTTITLQSLSTGVHYRVQIWGNDARGANSGSQIFAGINNATMLFGPSVNGAVGQWVIGTFTATATTQTFTVQSDTAARHINGIQLRSNP